MEWIRIQDCLPEENEKVLVFCPTIPDTYVAQYIPDRVSMRHSEPWLLLTNDELGDESVSPSHWMRFPRMESIPGYSDAWKKPWREYWKQEEFTKVYPRDVTFKE